MDDQGMPIPSHSFENIEILIKDIDKHSETSIDGRHADVAGCEWVACYPSREAALLLIRNICNSCIARGGCVGSRLKLEICTTCQGGRYTKASGLYTWSSRPTWPYFVVLLHWIAQQTESYVLTHQVLCLKFFQIPPSKCVSIQRKYYLLECSENV